MRHLILTILLIGFSSNCVNQKLKVFRKKILPGCGTRDKTIGMAFVHLHELGKTPDRYIVYISDSFSIVKINLRVKPPAIGGGALIKIDTISGLVTELKLYQ